MDHFEENFLLEPKQAHICFARCDNVPPNIRVGTTTSVVTTTIGLEEQASAPGSSGYIRSCAQSILL